ncbi:MAG: antibiotic biosynthesis monooxygenase family protein [Solirubrobacterales bacterium]
MSGTQGEYVVFNVVDVPISGADGFEQAFARRQSSLKEVEGFAGFELLRREDADQYVVVSRWRNEDAFKAWRSGEHFAKAHSGPERPEGERPTGSETQTFTVVLSEPASG